MGSGSVSEGMWSLPILFILAWFLYCSIHYRNPYRLTFIFGKKGAGKSCYMVRQMLRYRRKGWNVYTDMADVRIPGVRIISVKQLETFRPEPYSLVCLDEVGISMDNRNFKSFPPGLRDFFKYARKMKLVIIMNSQAYDVDKKVRDTTDSMMLMQSIGSFLSICRPVIRTVTLTEPSAEAESRIADSLRFGWIFSWKVFYMPAYFRYFDSLAMPDRPIVHHREAAGADERYGHGPLYQIYKDVIDLVRTKAHRLKHGE